MNKDQHPNEEKEAFIETCICKGKANQALEGGHVSEETENLAREMLRGNITPEQAIASLKKLMSENEELFRRLA